jgi:exopolyphosphatase / guanosine-5'-triphosphate,3'-diphosphate pyrophosphatase
VRVGIVDVGSNTLRLLVADAGPVRLDAVGEAKTRLALGEDIERLGYVTDEKVRALANGVREQCRRARKLGCERLEVLVASPGRQASNAGDIVALLERTSGAAVRILTAEEEAILAYDGATAAVQGLPQTVAVCDVGGGSTQLVVGSSEAGPAWLTSVDLGSLRLTQRMLGADPPGRGALDRASAEAAQCFSATTPPMPKAAYAVGGTARNLSRVVGPVLGPDELAEAIDLLAEVPRRRLVERFGISPARARTLAAGTVIFAEVQRRLAVELAVLGSGLREGAVLALAREAAAA